MICRHYLRRAGAASVIAAGFAIEGAGAAVLDSGAPGSIASVRSGPAGPPPESNKAAPAYQLEAKKADPKPTADKASKGKNAEDKKTDDKTDAKGAEAKGAEAKKTGKPTQVGTFGDWGVFVAQGAKDKTCYALAAPKDRAPAKLARDPAYVFISNRPGDNIRNEVSLVMGFVVKTGADVKADVGGTLFDFVPKGANAWIKNLSEEGQFVEALKKGSKLIVKAPSAKGNVTTDQYSLAGLSQALERVQKECP